MININNKEWNHLCADDVCSFLLGGGEENFFFEFKSDKEKNSKLVKKISAFANTYRDHAGSRQQEGTVIIRTSKIPAGRVQRRTLYPPFLQANTVPRKAPPLRQGGHS